MASVDEVLLEEGATVVFSLSLSASALKVFANVGEFLTNGGELLAHCAHKV